MMQSRNNLALFIIVFASIVLIVFWVKLPITNTSAQENTLSIKNKLMALSQQSVEGSPFIIHLDNLNQSGGSWLNERQSMIIKQQRKVDELFYGAFAITEVGDDYFCVSPYIDLAVSDNIMECVPFSRITSLSFTNEAHPDLNYFDFFHFALP